MTISRSDIPYLAGFMITSGPIIVDLLEHLSDKPHNSLTFVLAPHDPVRGEPGGEVSCKLTSLGVADQEGLRRIELVDELDHGTFRYIGYYNPGTGLGWISREYLEKSKRRSEPVEYMIGDEVHILTAAT